MRKTEEEIKAICTELNIDKLWSFSRFDCYKTDTYEYYLKYVLKAKPDKKDGIYGVSGGYCHDILERFYGGEIPYEKMITEYENSLLEMNLAELKYDRSDDEKNEKIAAKYEACIKHFFTHHNVVKHPNAQEEFILIKITDDIYLQGYIDFMYIDVVEGKKYLHIVDYKTSTKYSGDAITAHGKQLMIYAEGMRQKMNIPLEQIIIEWNFLKYVTVTYEQKNGTKKDRIIERHIIGESLANTIKMWLKAFGYDENEYLEEVLFSNSLDKLPQEVKDKFVIKDCYVQIPLSEEGIQELKNDISSTIAEIREKDKEYITKGNDEMVWWQEVTDADAFRLGVLSEYSRYLHRPFDEYLKQKEMFNSENEQSEEENDFSSFLNSL